MTRILITGATGNTGPEVIRFLFRMNTPHHIVAGVRDIDKAKNYFNEFPALEYRHFDFEDPATFDAALEGIGRIFLLRPPHISDTDRFFKPLILKIKEKEIRQVVFLSVQGAGRSRVIPHHKIEQLILQNGLEYIFLRPSYFMQNLTTTLLGDIRSKREIILPAGKAKFNWIDVENIGEAAAILLDKFENHKNQAPDLTGPENENFETVAALISSITGHHVGYRNMNPLRFYFLKKREGMNPGMIIVMILLHFLPRFMKEPGISGMYLQLTGKPPTDLKTFIERERSHFE